MQHLSLDNLAENIRDLHDDIKANTERQVENWSAVGALFASMTASERRTQREALDFDANQIRHMMQVATNPQEALAEAERMGWDWRFTLSKAASAVRRAAR